MIHVTNSNKFLLIFAGDLNINFDDKQSERLTFLSEKLNGLLKD